MGYARNKQMYHEYEPGHVPGKESSMSIKQIARCLMLSDYGYLSPETIEALYFKIRAALKEKGKKRKERISKK